MKKYLSCMIVFVMLLAFIFTGNTIADAEKISVVTTIFPIYDWARQIAGDRADIVMYFIFAGIERMRR